MRVLIAYDSGYGATAQVADLIGAALRDLGAQAEVCDLEGKLPVEYDFQIVGSPIRIGQVTPKIKQHLKASLNVAAPVPTALFLTCMTVNRPDFVAPYPLFVDPQFINLDKPRARLAVMEDNHSAANYLKALSKHLYGYSPLGVAMFRGRLQLAELGLWDWVLIRLIKLAMPEIQDGGDFIDQAVVRAWAKDLYPGILEL